MDAQKENKQSATTAETASPDLGNSGLAVEEEPLSEIEQGNDTSSVSSAETVEDCGTAAAGTPAASGNFSQKKDLKHKSRGGMITACVLLVLVLLLSFLAAYINKYDRIFPNIYVGGLALEGKTAEEALALLNDKYYTEKIKDLTIPFICEDSREEIPVNDLEVVYNNKETAANALSEGKFDNLIAKTGAFLFHMAHRTDLDPVIQYHTVALNQAIDAITAPYEIEPVGYTFKLEPNQVTLYGEVDGIKVDRQPVIEEVERQIKAMQFSEVVMVPQDTPPAPLDFDTFYAWLTNEAQNAYYVKGEDGKITVAPEKLKCTVDKETVQAAIEAVKTAPDNTYVFPVTTTEPEYTSAFLQEVLYKDKLGSYSTNFSGSAARINNVRLATSRINGYELMPDEEFSYDKTILPRTYANGYQAAPVYVGNKVESGLGGGICQPSSTLYCAALYANLEIVERHNHSLKVSYMPPGLDATIAQGVLDLRIKNNTGYPIKIAADASGGVVTFSIWGYNPENYSVDILRSGGGNTFHVTRVVKKDGVEVRREKMPSSQYQTPAPKESDKPA